MTLQDTKSELERINKQLCTLREQHKNAKAVTKGWVEKRDKLNDKFKKLCQEIREFKNERDKFNKKVKKLKQKRDDIRAEIKTCIDEIKAHNQAITERKKKQPRESRRELQKEFDAIEWKIQTTPLDMQEEKRQMHRVKQLEMQLSVFKKIDQHVKKTSELRKEIEQLKSKAGIAHKELTDIAESSQNIHAKMIAKIAESKDIKAKADSLHKAYIQAKEQDRPLHEEIKKLNEQRKKLQEHIRDKEAKSKKRLERALKKKLGSQAKDKLQRGEKLSWNEFKLLTDEDSQN